MKTLQHSRKKIGIFSIICCLAFLISVLNFPVIIVNAEEQYNEVFCLNQDKEVRMISLVNSPYVLSCDAEYGSWSYSLSDYGFTFSGSLMLYFYEYDVKFENAGIYNLHFENDSYVSDWNILVSDHSWNSNGILVQPSCVNEGSEKYTCSNCGKEKTEMLNKTEHLWNATYTIIIDSTCIEDGIEKILCSVCDIAQEETERNIPAKGHLWNDDFTIEQKPTCIEKGSKSIHCSGCDIIKQDSSEEIEATGHTGGTATCKDEAVCETCHEGYGELDKNNHAGETEVSNRRLLQVKTAS